MADNAEYEPVDHEFDQCVERFESSWRSGNIPAIGDFLGCPQRQRLSAAQLHELLIELVIIDMEYRWRRAGQLTASGFDASPPIIAEFPQQPHLKDYVARFPQLGPLRQLSTELIASEYRVRHRWGDRPGHQEYFERFAERRRAVSQALQRVDARLPQSSGSPGLCIRCPYCQVSIALGDHDLGVKLTCPYCDQGFNLIDDDQSDRRLGAVDRIGAFELLERLGSGSFGVVWKSRDTQLDRYVAVKLPHQGLFDFAQREQFLREARTAAQLNHSNIVPVYEVGREDDRLFIVTELVPGMNLADWLKGQRPTPREAASLCVQLADALEHAHQRGVVHRDVKPSNIMLDATGEPRLMDFGLAKRAADEVTLTVEGKLLGSPAYMPPEQARGSAHQADSRSDIYSLGVILFELLAGERPFGGSTEVLLQRIISEDASSPRHLSRSIPKDLETICLKCLEKDRDRRFQTAADLRDDLRRFLHGEPVHARPITKADRLWRWCKRNPVVATLGTTVGTLLLFLAVAGPLVALTQARLASREAEARAREVSAQDKMRRQLYVSDMDVALQAWEAADVRRVLELLGRHEPQTNQRDLRRFEWYYLWRLCQRSEHTPTLTHELPVTLLAFSADGTTLASAGAQVGYGYEVKLWDSRSGSQRALFKLEQGVIWSGAFSPDAETIALGYSDGTIKLCNVSNRELEITLAGTKEQILSLSFSPDGAKLASRSRDAVKLWDLATRQPEWTIPTGEGATTAPPIWLMPMSFSPNGEVLAWGTTNGNIELRDAASGQERATLDKHTDAINSVAFSPGGRTLASSSVDHTVNLWDVTSAELLHSLEGHQGFVFSVAFSADGTTLASGSLDNTVKIWDVVSGKEKASLKGHAGWVTSVAFSPTGATLASGGEDRTVKLWNVAGDIEKDVLEGHSNFVWSAAFSPDGKTLASGSWDKTVKLWDVATGEIHRTLRGHSDWIWSVAFSPNGKTLATGSGILASGSRKGRVKLWDFATGEVLRESSLSTTTVRSLAFSPGGKTVALGTEDGGVMLLDAANLQLRKAMGRHADSVLSVAFSPDGKTLASGGRDNLVKLWDVESGRHRDCEGHAGWVYSVAFSPDGKLLASGNRDNTVKLWDPRTTREQATLKGHAGWVMCVAFSPDGNTLVAGDANRMVKLWDVATKELRVTLKGHQGGVHSVAFSPSGNILASGDNVHKIRLWRAATEQKVQAAGELPDR